MIRTQGQRDYTEIRKQVSIAQMILLGNLIIRRRMAQRTTIEWTRSAFVYLEHLVQQHFSLIHTMIRQVTECIHTRRYYLLNLTERPLDCNQLCNQKYMDS